MCVHCVHQAHVTPCWVGIGSCRLPSPPLQSSTPSPPLRNGPQSCRTQAPTQSQVRAPIHKLPWYGSHWNNHCVLTRAKGQLARRLICRHLWALRKVLRICVGVGVFVSEIWACVPPWAFCLLHTPLVYLSASSSREALCVCVCVCVCHDDVRRCCNALFLRVHRKALKEQHTFSITVAILSSLFTHTHTHELSLSHTHTKTY